MWKDNIQNKNMLYLLYCSIHGIEPDPVYLQNFDPEQLLSKCISHKVVALINNEVTPGYYFRRNEKQIPY